MSRYAVGYDESRMKPTIKARLAVVILIAGGIGLLSFLMPKKDADDGANQTYVAAFQDDRTAGGPPNGTAGQTLDRTSSPGFAVLQRMLETYQSLSTLRERTKLQIEVERPGQGTVRETIDMRLAYEAPNRLRFVVSRPKHEITVACNGEQLQSYILNPATNDFDHQFVQRAAPRRIDVTTVFSATEFSDPSRPNDLLSALLDIPIDMTITSLGMLSGQGTLPTLLQEATKIELLQERRIQESLCDVVRVVAARGTYLFAVDKETNLLRRVDRPAARIAGPSEPHRGDPSNARLFSEHVCNADAHFAESEFDLVPPADAQLVRHFVAPPQPAEQTGLLNAKVPPFSFTDLNGQNFASQSWDGRHAILIWFNRHPACRQLLTSLGPVFDRYASDNRVFFCAVSTEPTTTVGNQDLRNLAASWGISIPVVRDLDLVGRDIFSVQQAPTIVITSPADSGGSRIQVVEVGWHEQLAEQLPTVIDKLLDGENLAEAFIQFVAQREREYKRCLASASVTAPETEIDASTEIAATAPFERLSLNKIWEVTDVDHPGNISVDQMDGRHVLLVHDGWHEVVTIATDGQILARSPIPNGTEISRLQLLRLPNGETLYAGSAALGKQAVLLDSHWRQLLKYPKHATGTARIQDVVLTDLDADNKLEMYVGFSGADGVHRVDLNGSQVWANRRLNSVLSLTAVHSGTGRQLLVTTSDGSLVPMDADGQLGQPFSIGARAIHHLLAGPVQANATPWYCGLTYNVHGNLLAVGLNDQLAEAWNYPLPPGNATSQIEICRYGQVVPMGGLPNPDATDRAGRAASWQWLFAGPDGSVHVVGPAGDFHDHFNTGAPVNGLAGFRDRDTYFLVVASPGKVTGYTVDRR